MTWMWAIMDWRMQLAATIGIWVGTALIYIIVSLAVLVVCEPTIRGLLSKRDRRTYSRKESFLWVRTNTRDALVPVSVVGYVLFATVQGWQVLVAKTAAFGVLVAAAGFAYNAYVTWRQRRLDEQVAVALDLVCDEQGLAQLRFTNRSSRYAYGVRMEVTEGDPTQLPVDLLDYLSRGGIGQLPPGDISYPLSGLTPCKDAATIVMRVSWDWATSTTVRMVAPLPRDQEQRYIIDLADLVFNVN